MTSTAGTCFIRYYCKKYHIILRAKKMSILYHMHHILEVLTLHKLPVVQETSFRRKLLVFQETSFRRKLTVVQETSFRRKPTAGPEIMFSHKPLEDRGYACLHYKRYSDQDSSFQQASFLSIGKILDLRLGQLRPARLCPGRLCQVLDPYKDHSRLGLRQRDRLCKAGWG